MKLSYDYGTQKIEFTVVYRKRKTLSIEVEAPNTITIIAPLGTSEQGILEVVKPKSKWIVQKLFEIKEVQYLKTNKQYVNGESFTYLGRKYSLQFIHDENITFPEVKLLRGKLVAYANNKDEESIKKAIKNWYKEKAKVKIQERINYYQDYFKIKPSKVLIKEQQKRWGSCTSKGELLFNWKCIMTPSPILDYIIVHEMCHLVHLNHSKEFWQLLKRVLPDYEERKGSLKNNGIKYDL